MHLVVAQIDKKLAASKFGPKAHWLSWLVAEGYCVPPAHAFEAASPELHIKYANSFSGGQAIIEAASHFLEHGLYHVAIRSSAANEDGLQGSQAGRFSSFLGPFNEVQLIEKYCAVAQSSILAFPETPPAIGIIIQRLIDPLCSGVAFSANPVSGSRDEAIISIALGTSDKLVSGEAPDEEIFIQSKIEQILSENISSKLMSKRNLNALVKTLSNVEKKAHIPVDIEWAIDQNQQLNIVQCRPVVFPQNSATNVDISNEEQLPSIIRNNPKVSTRLEGQRLGIHVSPAIVVIKNIMDDSDLFHSEVNAITNDVDTAGYSVVLLHPRHIKNKIQRAFVGDAKSISSILEKCERYAVRDYPEFDEIENCVSSFIEKGLEESWYSVAIIQTIYQAEYTGIVKKQGEFYIIEMARGHFVPKGIVDTAMHILTSDSQSKKSVSCEQRKIYDILDGAIVIGEDCKEIVSIDSVFAKSILNKFMPLLESGTVVEFGVTYQRGENPSKLYLIDVVDSSTGNETDLDISLLESGVISSGTTIGEVRRITEENDDAVHSHFHDEGNEETTTDSNPIIYFADMPSISLQKYLTNPVVRNMGFVFSSGSLLSHFSILLREAGVPAMILNEEHWPSLGETVVLDCSDQSLDAKQRIRKQAT